RSWPAPDCLEMSRPPRARNPKAPSRPVTPSSEPAASTISITSQAPGPLTSGALRSEASTARTGKSSPTLCMALYLGGMATVDELYFPTKGWSGLTLRTFELAKHQWSIYWVSSARGKLETPVVGGFDGEHGEFYGEDVDGGRPVKVRYTWNKV